MDEILQLLEHYKLYNLAILGIIIYVAVKLTSKSTKFFKVVEDHGTQLIEINESMERHLTSDEKFHGELFDRMNKTEIDVARIKGKLNGAH